MECTGGDIFYLTAALIREKMGRHLIEVIHSDQF